MIRRPFPTHALPSRIRFALLECQALTKSPPELLASSALSVMSTACQDKIDIVRPGGLRGPISLFFISIAESGERKSSGDRLMSQEVKAFDEEHADKHRLLFEKYRAKLGAWEDRRRRLLAKLNDEETQLAQEDGASHHEIEDGDSDVLDDDQRGSESDEQEAAEALLEQHLANKPVAPARPCLLLSDATREAIFVRLHNVWPIAALLSDDAGIIFASKTLRDLGLLNKLWDGDPVTRDRVTSESFTLRGARLTLSLMTQADVLKDFLKNGGQLAQSIGFMARSMLCQSESTMGTRFTYGTEPVWQAMPGFRERVRELLAASVRAPGQRPEPTIPVLMTEAAANSWIGFHNNVEMNLGFSGYYSDVKDWASKIAENTARMAAGFHLFEGKSGPVDLESVDQAKEICSWYLEEAKRFVTTQLRDPPEIVDARAVEQFLFRWMAKFPFATSIRKNSLLQVGPVRVGARLEYSLAVLCQEGKIDMFMQGKTWFVVPNPAHFRKGGGFGGAAPLVPPMIPPFTPLPPGRMF